MGLFIDARYNISVTDIASNDLKVSMSDQDNTLHKATNKVFTLSVGWRF